MNVPPVVLILFAVLIVLTAVFALFLYREVKRGRFRSTLAMSLFLVRFPRYEAKENAQNDIKQLIGKASQLYSAFAGMKHRGIIENMINGPLRIVLEIASPSNEEEIGFYIAVPKRYESHATKIIHGSYPDAQIEKVPGDYNIFAQGSEIAGSLAVLERRFHLPIRTYQEFDSDPLGQIAESLGKIPHYKGAAIQLVLVPVTNAWYKNGKKTIKRIKEGKLEEKPNLAPLPSAESFIGREKEEPEKKQPEPEVDQEMIEAISKKIARPAFYTNIRLIAAAPNKEEAEAILSQLEQPFYQFSLPKLNSFKLRRLPYAKLQTFIYRFSFRDFLRKQAIVLNTDELASVFHFPYPGLTIPGLKSVASRESALPSELPDKGVRKIGETLFRGETKDVSFASIDDRRRHFYIIGQTGTGKSYFLQEMIRQDIEDGYGVGVVDPHGDLIEATLASIPRERFDDVVLFEPFELERPQGLNMLEWETPEQKDFAVQEMIGIFQKLFPPEIIGPMFEHYMRNAMLALMARKDQPGTLVEVPRIFTDDAFMDEYLAHVDDPVVRSFWLREWRQTTGQSRSDMLGYVVSKVGRFVENEMMRNIIGQSHSAFDLGKVMNEQKIFLANLSKGKTGEVNSSLLGLILISKIQMAAMRRADMPSEERKDFYLYVDEFQNFTTDSIATILSEARKYRLNLIMAHQYIAQLDEKIRDAAFGNVGTIASLRISQSDADIMEKQFEPDFSRFDLINLPNRQVVLKLLINGNVTKPFKIKTPEAKIGNYDQVAHLRKLSHLKYGRSRDIVQKEIITRSNLSA